MAITSQEDFDQRMRELAQRLRDEKSGSVMDNLEATLNPNTKLAYLPDFPELARLKDNPRALYQKAVELRVDRNTIEEKVLVPVRRAIAAAIDARHIAKTGKRIVPQDMDELREAQSLMLDDLVAIQEQLLIIQMNLIDYEGVGARENMERILYGETH